MNLPVRFISCFYSLQTGLVLLLLHCSPAVFGQIYTFTNDAGGVPASVAAHATATNLTRGSGLDPGGCGGGQGFGAEGWLTLPYSASNLNVIAEDFGKYIEFSVTPDPGYQLFITGMTARLRRDDPAGTNYDGPTDIRYAYSTNGGASFVRRSFGLTPEANSACNSAGDVQNWNNFGNGTVTQNTVIFRIYGFSGGSFGLGELYIRDLTILGTVSTLCGPPEISNCTTPVSINFSGYAGSGFHPAQAGALCSRTWIVTGLSGGGSTTFDDIELGGSAGRGNTAAGSVSNGGLYTLQGNGLWMQPAISDLTPGNIYLFIRNTSGQTLNNVQLNYKIKVLNDQSNSSFLNVAIATGPYGTIPGVFTNVPALDYTTPRFITYPISIVTVNRSAILSGFTLMDNQCLYIRWNTNDADYTSGARDEFGLDDIVVSIPIAEPPTIAKSPDLPSVCSGASLTATITTPGTGGAGNCSDGYRYSTDNGGSWSAWSTTMPVFAAVTGTNLLQSRRNCDASGCASSTNEISWTVTADIAPVADAGGPYFSTDCSGTIPVAISATASGAGMWSGGAGSFADASSTTTSYTPTAGEAGTIVNLNWTTSGVSPCADESDVAQLHIGLQEIAVQGNGLDIAYGDASPAIADHTDFGPTAGASIRTYSILNSGPSALTLPGGLPVTLSGAHAGDFAVTVQPSSPVVASGGLTTFNIQFTPSAAGLRAATVIVANDDCDENPFTFDIQGTGTIVPPQISVSGNGNPVTNRALAVSATNDTDFGNVNVAGGMVTHSFTIENAVGSSGLKLDGLPLVEVADRNQSDFIVTQPVVNTLAGGSSTIFDVKFDPSATGLRSAIIIITHNDLPDNPYIFTVQGMGQ